MDVLRNAWEVADRFIDEQSDGFKFEGPMSSAVPAVGSVAIYLLMIPLLKQVCSKFVSSAVTDIF